jgi:hypothetical protein
MTEREQAIVAAAKAYVEALEHLAEVRKQRGYCDIKDFQVMGQSRGFRVRVDREMRQARAARKRTLSRLRRAVDQCRPLPGQKVLFQFPVAEEAR